MRTDLEMEDGARRTRRTALRAGAAAASAGVLAACQVPGQTAVPRMDERDVTLTYPADADIAERRISILTPVGTALIGLRAGQSISFRTRDGRPQMLTVLSVRPPETEDDPGPWAA